MDITVESLLAIGFVAEQYNGQTFYVKDTYRIAFNNTYHKWMPCVAGSHNFGSVYIDTIEQLQQLMAESRG
jgi:hypothetical protein